ncbi:hypothetical protein AVEN_266025-1 [Araneus ventricosus]|uniref:Uncharacterized protein n=1 Tax=Araneus ventricosus TaxID=182803 RepID=A0A4Y2ILN3_ARAVE|nr:hypothetical protein AVEN_266025-1 [Araneus ventricosus]
MSRKSDPLLHQHRHPHSYQKPHLLRSHSKWGRKGNWDGFQVASEEEERGRGGLVVRSRLWGRRAPVSKPDSTNDSLCMGPAVRSGQTPSRWCGVEAWRGVPSQVSSSSSDRGSKLRGPSPNSPRVASKRDVNITKPKKKLRSINSRKILNNK